MKEPCFVAHYEFIMIRYYYHSIIQREVKCSRQLSLLPAANEELAPGQLTNQRQGGES